MNVVSGYNHHRSVRSVFASMRALVGPCTPVVIAVLSALGMRRLVSDAWSGATPGRRGARATQQLIARSAGSPYPGGVRFPAFHEPLSGGAGGSTPGGR